MTMTTTKPDLAALLEDIIADRGRNVAGHVWTCDPSKRYLSDELADDYVQPTKHGVNDPGLPDRDRRDELAKLSRRMR